MMHHASEVADMQYRAFLHSPLLLTLGAEAHGGATYCGTASLTLLGAVEELGEGRVGAIKQWCMSRRGWLLIVNTSACELSILVTDVTVYALA